MTTFRDFSMTSMADISGRVLYEDNHIIIVNKLPGEIVQADKTGDATLMDDIRAYYTYRAQSNDFNYLDAAGPFDSAILNSVGMAPILGGDDKKVIEACNACYENLKQRTNRKNGCVIIYKTRHPDGRQKILTTYAFQ